MTPTIDIYIERSPGIPGGAPWTEVRWTARDVDFTTPGTTTRCAGYSGTHLVDPPALSAETVYVWSLIDQFAGHCDTDRDHLDIAMKVSSAALIHLTVTPGTGTR